MALNIHKAEYSSEFLMEGEEWYLEDEEGFKVSTGAEWFHLLTVIQAVFEHKTPRSILNVIQHTKNSLAYWVNLETDAPGEAVEVLLALEELETKFSFNCDLELFADDFCDVLSPLFPEIDQSVVFA